MKYMGGKYRQAKAYAQFFKSHYKWSAYYEPFCGMCSVLERIDGPRFASDAHPEVIALWQALQRGWVPPDKMDEDTWRHLKNGHGTPELRAFAGFGCSFGGRYFEGYARGRDYAASAQRALLRKLTRLQDVTFSCHPYSSISPPAGTLVYCDPPYAGTKGYAVGNFNHEVFWGWVREMSDQHTVLVSEFTAPPDFVPVFSLKRNDSIRRGDRARRIESIYQHIGQ